MILQNEEFSFCLKNKYKDSPIESIQKEDTTYQELNINGLAYPQ